MRACDLSHLNDAALLRGLDSLVAQERSATAMVLAHIAEVDERRLYLPEGYPSMFEYCVRRLHFSEYAAYKRIRAGRTARQFPAIFEAAAEGRLHLSAVVLLAAHLTSVNAAELPAAATHRTKAEIELLIAQRFPRPDVPAGIEPLPPPPPMMALASEMLSPSSNAFSPAQLAPGPVEVQVPRPKVAPLAPQRYALQLTIDQETHDLLRHVQSLLSHRIPSGDVAQVFLLALRAVAEQLQRERLAATERPRPYPSRASANARHIPAYVKRAVWRRDQGRCTFVSDRGERCGSRRFLEFDHVEPVARGGEATMDTVRLRCRGHNQLEAERVFGAAFMSAKREEARRAAARRPEMAPTAS